ncbi:MAG: hypothetical protein OEV94_06820 [Deltaproteobacteria bacterium]|nr:hypothetical protein [Deltaproteobacteria bacterium]
MTDKFQPSKWDIRLLNEEDTLRGIALIAIGGVLVLLKWIVPYAAPLALVVYAGLQAYTQRYGEAIVALALAVLLWQLKELLEGLVWVAGVLAATGGFVFLLRNLKISVG